MNLFPKKVRVRFAPSPTGFLHLGGLRTALYNYLFAKHQGGAFLLRIEDTDQTRFVPGATQNIIDTLRWAGMDYDEGPILNGDVVADKGSHGPYLQSRRLETYKKYVTELVENGHAYPCFCTSERLDQMRKEQQLKKLPPMYDGTCRELTPALVKAKRDEGAKEVIRMKIPRDGVTTFVDVVHGAVEFKNALIDDQVLLKSDGFPTYHLAVVVDDHLMEITHVIRGEDWLPSTPKHILLYKFFGWDVPSFAHIPLFLATGGGKLSKRDTSTSAMEFVQQGYLKEAVLNFVSLLGWHPKGDNEVLSIDEMVKEFEIKDVHKSGAIFNTEKLDYLNGLYIRKMSPKDFATAARPYLVGAGLISEDFSVDILAKMVVLEQARIKKFTELADAIEFLFKEPAPTKEVLCWKKQEPADAISKLVSVVPVLGSISDWSERGIEQVVKAHIAASGSGVGETLWPLRVALSGREASPGPFAIAAVLGKEATKARIEKAISTLRT